MYQPDIGQYPEWFARLLLGTMWVFGQGDQYAPGKSGNDWNSPFVAGNDYTSSEVRSEFGHSLLLANPEYAVGGPTNNWVLQAMAAHRFITRYASSFQVPTLVMMANEDHVVVPEAERYVCEQAVNCELLEFPQSKHEILMERDEFRDVAISRMLEFFSKH
jgi:lysophospholipase